LIFLEGLNIIEVIDNNIFNYWLPEKALSEKVKKAL